MPYITRSSLGIIKKQRKFRTNASSKSESNIEIIELPSKKSKHTPSHQLLKKRKLDTEREIDQVSSENAPNCKVIPDELASRLNIKQSIDEKQGLYMLEYPDNFLESDEDDKSRGDNIEDSPTSCIQHKNYNGLYIPQCEYDRIMAKKLALELPEVTLERLRRRSNRTKKRGTS